MSHSAGQIHLYRDCFCGLRKYYSLLTNDMVYIYVGPNCKCYYLHRELLRSASDFFRRHFTKRQSPGALPEKECKLADTDPALFELFITWLYQRTLDAIPHRRLGRRGPSTYSLTVAATTTRKSSMSAMELTMHFTSYRSNGLFRS